MSNDELESKVAKSIPKPTSEPIPKPEKISKQLIRGLLWTSTILLVLTLGLAWFFYPSVYTLWRDYISYLGGIDTVFGVPNQLSRYIFTVGFWINAILALFMAILYFRLRPLTSLNIIKGISLLLMAFGAFGTGFPYDKPGSFLSLLSYDLLHDLGATIYLLAANTYIFFCQFTRYKRRRIEFESDPTKKLGIDKILVITIFGLILAYFLIFCGRMLFPAWNTALFIVMVILQKVILVLFVVGVVLLDLDDI